MLYTTLYNRPNIPNIVRVRTNIVKRIKVLQTVKWCQNQESNGYFDYEYFDDFNVTVWYFTNNADALLFRLQWL